MHMALLRQLTYIHTYIHTARRRLARTRRSAAVLGRPPRRFLVANGRVRAKVVHFHLAVEETDELPRLLTVPRPPIPPVFRLVVRVIILCRAAGTRSLRASRVKHPAELVRAILHIAVARHNAGVLMAVTVRVIVSTGEIFRIEFGTCATSKSPRRGVG